MQLPFAPPELAPVINAIFSNFSLLVSVATIGLVVIEGRRLRRERSQEEREQGNLGIERRRLTEANLKVGHSLILTNHQQGRSGEYPFTVFYLPLANKGDGPVDIWASLVSSRMLSSTVKPGIGLRSRDVEWTDYKPFFWNESTSQDMFAGSSTTKNMVADVGHFTRLASHEESTLRRIDGVNNPKMLQQLSPITVMYRVFVVARGYPLGEILRQLGGGPPDPLQNVNKNQLQFRAIAQPTFTRWRSLQQALTNLNRVSFRIATGEPDPLGKLIEPDAWRFFLLSHEDFSDQATIIALEEVAEEVRKRYPNYILDDAFQTSPDFAPFQKDCATKLQGMVAKWRKLLQVIEECAKYDVNGYDAVDIPGRLPLPTGRKVRALHNESIPNDGYPMRVWIDPVYQAKWLKYMNEGYLISRPFPRKERSWRRLYLFKRSVTKVSAYDIPADPRVLEPFVMRTHYFLETIDTHTTTHSSQTLPPSFPDSNADTHIR